MSSDVKWIKITTDIFDDEKILLIESLPDAYAIITVWFKLLCLAGKQNNSGVFMMGKVAYTDKMLATIFRMKETTVQLALQTFEQFGMVEIIDGVITIPNWGKHQNLDQLETRKEFMRNYMRDYRAKQKALTSGDNGKPSCKPNSKPNVRQAEEEREEEREEELETDKKSRTDFQSVIDLYHKICVSFPSVRSLSEARKKAIRARLNTYTLDDFKTVFENAEASSFLKGRNDRNWSANFDWLIADKNMAKVLEGNYADKPKPGSRKEIVPSWMERAERKDEFAAIVQQSVRAMHERKGNDPELADRVKRLRERLNEQ